MPGSALNRLARLSAAAAFLLLIAGGLVTSTGSSLAVPDWPLSYGQYFPPMRGGVLFEHGHRMMAGTVAVLTWVLAAWIWLKDGRRWVKRAAAAAAFGIALQAVLGGITVLYGLPHSVSIAHACLGQAIFCLLVALAEVTGWEGRAAPDPSWKIGAFAVVALYLQLILGAVLRHTGSALPFHILGALLASGAVAWMVYTRPSLCPAVLLPLQLVLGLAALAARSRRAAVWSAALPTAHVACGALLLGASVLWTLRAWRGRTS